MNVGYDIATVGISNTGTSGSWSHTCTGTDLVLLVGIYNGTARDPSSVTYNGVALTKLGSVDFNSGRLLYYYLLNPATGSNTVAVNGVSGDAWNCDSISFTSCSAVQNFASGNTNANSLSTSFTSSIGGGNMISTFLLWNNGGVNASPSNSQIQVGTTSTVFPRTMGYKASGASSTAIGWALTGVVQVGQVGAELVAKTNFSASVSASVSNAVSRLATITKVTGKIRSLTASVSNAVSRLAVLTKTVFHPRTLSVSVTNAVSRFIELFRYKNYTPNSRTHAVLNPDNRNANPAFTVNNRSSSTFTNDIKHT